MDLPDSKAAFLRQLQNVICKHPYDSFHIYFKDGDRILICTQCFQSVSLRFRFCYSRGSSNLSEVEDYVKWTRDYDIPFRLDIHNFDNPLFKYPSETQAYNQEIFTTYATLARGCKLLKLLHYPFHCQSQEARKEQILPTDALFVRNILETTLDRLINAYEHRSSDSVGIVTLNTLLFIRSVVRTDNYFRVLVPYVKGAQERHSGNHWHKCFDLEREPTLKGLLERLMFESTHLHRTFAPFSLSFDAVHTAALCYLFQDNLETVQDHVLDFLGKVCRGYYDKSFAFPGQPVLDPIEKKIRKLFAEHVSPQHNTRIYRFLELCWMGGTKLEEGLSANFFTTYWDLKSAVAKQVLRGADKDHFELLFPRILFHNYADYYAFTTALAHYSMELKLGSVSVAQILAGMAGVPSAKLLSECKMLFRWIKTCLSKVKVFHECLVEVQGDFPEHRKLFEEEPRRKIIRYYWTKDLLKRFFAGDLEFERKLMSVTEKWAKLAWNREEYPDLNREPIGDELLHEQKNLFDGVDFFTIESLWESLKKKNEEEPRCLEKVLENDKSGDDAALIAELEMEEIYI